MELFNKLWDLKEKDDLEFKYQLRNLMHKNRGESIDDFLELVQEFKREIIYNSFFFIDILNESIFYFYWHHKDEPEMLGSIMDIIHIVAPIGDRDTLEMLNYVLKKVPRHSSYYPVLMNYYGEIEHKISFMEQKIHKLKLHPQKPMIMEWHE